MRMVAIVIGQGGYNDLGLIRSCGEAKMDVILLSPEDSIMPIHKSRYVKQWIPTDTFDPESIKEEILKAIDYSDNKECILFPASDLAASVIDELYSNIPSSCIAPNAKGKLLNLMDKWRMAKIATQSGFSVPNTAHYNLSSDTPSFKDNCIIKPAKSINGGKTVIKICKNQETFDKAIKNCKNLNVNEIIIQELIDSRNQEEVAVTGVSTLEGALCFGMIHKFRTVDNGSTVFAKFEASDIPEDLISAITNFMDITGYKGIFDIEFLHNDSGYHFIECNFRNGAYGYAVTSAGFNMPEAFLHGMTGVKYQKNKIRDRVFMEERSDLLNSLRHNISWATWIKDVLRTDTFLWWNRRDPRPMIRVPYFIKRLLRK